MAIDTTASAHPVAGALTGIGETLDAAADASVWSLSGDDLLAALEETQRLAARLAGLQLRLVAEADARGLAGDHAAPSTAALLRHRLRLDPRDAKNRVKLANHPHLIATRAALAAGDLGVEHARVIRTAVSAVPVEVRGQAEAFLIGEAAVFDPGQLQKLARHLRHVVDPDTVERDEQRPPRHRELSIFDRGDGTHGLRGVLDQEAAEKLLTVLDPLAAPQPAADGTRDPRTSPQRYADALVAALDRLLDDGTLLPHARGARPHVQITAGLDTLLKLPGAPAADLAFTGPVSAETLRRIACDADVTFVLLDQHGVPLDVGREHRTVTPGLWAALVVRDRGCIFPGVRHEAPRYRMGVRDPRRRPVAAGR